DLEHLSSSFRIPVIRLEEMRSAAPRFDLMPYPESARRRTAVLQTVYGSLLAVLGNPWDAATQVWIEEHVRDRFAYRLAPLEEVDAWLAQQEEGLRAMDGVNLERRESAQEVVPDLSIEAISDAANPVVRLVNSTLYDALRAGASD